MFYSLDNIRSFTHFSPRHFWVKAASLSDVPYAASHEESLKKLEYDLFYSKNISFLLDLAIILKTIRVVLFGRGGK